jgi:hypothetical protein
MYSDSRFKRKPRNGCGACFEDFAGITEFDKHRVGSHEPLERRCLTEAEMKELGWKKNDKGRWYDPIRVDSVKEAFAK